jgi:hypothetical protein
VKFCTVANAATLPAARVLAEGLAQHHPGAGLTVLFAAPDHLAAGSEPFDVLDPSALSVPGWERLLEGRRWADLNELLKPHLMSRLLEEGASAAVFLDATIDLLAPLDPVRRALERHAAVVVPCVRGELPDDGRRPDAEELRRAGRFSTSMIAAGQDAPELLHWWADRLAAGARRPPSAVFGPAEPRRELSRWLELAPGVFEDVAVIDDPGLAASRWNLHERTLSREPGSVTADGRPLRFLHFEGFDPLRPFLLAEGSDRVRTSEHPVLGGLCESYAERLIEAGWRDLRRRADVGLRLANGMTFDNRLSLLLADAAASGEEPEDLFSAEGTEAFMRWLERPAFPGSGSPINRYLYAIYQERDDLRVVYPDLVGSDSGGFAGWAWAFGLREMGIPERFLPPRPPGIEAVKPHRISIPPLPRGGVPELSMNVTGLLRGTLGLGEAARGYVRALEAADLPVSTSSVDVREFVKLAGAAHQGYAQVEYADLAGAERAGFNLICINADELVPFAESIGEDFFHARPNVGVWAWETDHVPERWQDAYGLLDEIWVYSTYVAENLSRTSPIPVYRIPPPVSPPEPGGAELDLHVPDGFRFMFMFDFFSTIQRKNPIGLIEAFRLAFAPGEGPQLVLKTINGVHRPQALEQVLWAARGRPDIHVVDRSLSARERDALVASCDCYVSLHRSEGLGLTLAECMLLEKPVIGTGFSATTDFMTEENSYLVPYTMTRVGADCEIYPPEGTWADPDLGEAARLMRRVFEQPNEACAKGDVARRDIERLYSPGAVGALIRSRLENLIALWP